MSKPENKELQMKTPVVKRNAWQNIQWAKKKTLSIVIYIVVPKLYTKTEMQQLVRYGQTDRNISVPSTKTYWRRQCHGHERRIVHLKCKMARILFVGISGVSLSVSQAEKSAMEVPREVRENSRLDRGQVLLTDTNLSSAGGCPCTDYRTAP